MSIFLFAALLLHPVHETVAEIEWNVETKRLEVALRFDVLDEQWLQKKYARQRELSKWALPYLQKRFRIAEGPKKNEPDSSTYRWVGREVKGSHVWWYFEIVPRDGDRPVWVEQRVLFEREENYTNRVLILDQLPRRSLVLTSKRPKADLAQAIDDTTATSPADR